MREKIKSKGGMAEKAEGEVVLPLETEIDSKVKDILETSKGEEGETTGETRDIPKEDREENTKVLFDELRGEQIFDKDLEVATKKAHLEIELGALKAELKKWESPLRKARYQRRTPLEIEKLKKEIEDIDKELQVMDAIRDEQLAEESGEKPIGLKILYALVRTSGELIVWRDRIKREISNLSNEKDRSVKDAVLILNKQLDLIRQELALVSANLSAFADGYDVYPVLEDPKKRVNSEVAKTIIIPAFEKKQEEVKGVIRRGIQKEVTEKFGGNEISQLKEWQRELLIDTVRRSVAVVGDIRHIVLSGLDKRLSDLFDDTGVILGPFLGEQIEEIIKSQKSILRQESEAVVRMKDFVSNLFEGKRLEIELFLEEHLGDGIREKFMEKTDLELGVRDLRKLVVGEYFDNKVQEKVLEILLDRTDKDKIQEEWNVLGFKPVLRAVRERLSKLIKEIVDGNADKIYAKLRKEIAPEVLITGYGLMLLQNEIRYVISTIQNEGEMVTELSDDNEALLLKNIFSVLMGRDNLHRAITQHCFDKDTRARLADKDSKVWRSVLKNEIRKNVDRLKFLERPDLFFTHSTELSLRRKTKEILLGRVSEFLRANYAENAIDANLLRSSINIISKEILHNLNLSELKLSGSGRIGLRTNRLLSLEEVTLSFVEKEVLVLFADYSLVEQIARGYSKGENTETAKTTETVPVSLDAYFSEAEARDIRRKITNIVGLVFDLEYGDRVPKEDMLKIDKMKEFMDKVLRKVKINFLPTMKETVSKMNDRNNLLFKLFGKVSEASRNKAIDIITKETEVATDSFLLDFLLAKKITKKENEIVADVAYRIIEPSLNSEVLEEIDNLTKIKFDEFIKERIDQGLEPAIRDGEVIITKTPTAWTREEEYGPFCDRVAAAVLENYKTSSPEDLKLMESHIRKILDKFKGEHISEKQDSLANYHEW